LFCFETDCQKPLYYPNLSWWFCMAHHSRKL